MGRDIKDPDLLSRHRKAGLFIIFVAVIAAAVMVFTSELNQIPGSFFATQSRYLIAGELVVFVTILVELIGRLIVSRLQERNALQIGVAIRAILRTIVYIILAVAVVSLLSLNPALAVSVGTITGIVVGFAAQSIIGNMLASVMLAIWYPAKVGDRITVLGTTGRIVEIRLIYTVLDTGEQSVFIPNSMMLNNAVQCNKAPGEKEAN